MIGTCRLLGTFLHPPPPLLSHPHHVDTYVDTDKQTTTRTKTGHGRCPIWFEYGAGAAGYLSLYLTLLLFQQSSYLSFWHAGECTILFFYSSYLVTDWDYLHLDLPPLWTSKRRRLSVSRACSTAFPAYACAFYRLQPAYLFSCPLQPVDQPERHRHRLVHLRRPACLPSCAHD